jgi:ABC-type transport system substrate-binding protein
LYDVVPGGDPDLYDFWSQEAIVDGQNFGSWNHRRASEALEEARQTWDQEKRKAAYQRFSYYFRQDVPALSLYQYVTAFALHPSVIDMRTPSGQAEVGLSRVAVDRFRALAGWYYRTSEQQINCDALP